ncbi:MAG: SDR family NAD(P)-dependent oxidoreductase [Deltaproteobacteria bacterium]|nr:SDR family NAD(P)-dependent oxidoreductase [Deltaproteobacteria bacterium]
MTEIRFDDRVAIVTGAGNGLGREYALLLAARGARVLVNDYGGNTMGSGRSEGPARDVVAEIEGSGGVAAASTDSVAESAGGAAIVAAALDRWGRVDIVVNNAGIADVGPAFEDLDDDRIHAFIETHLFGAFNVLRPAWRAMRERGYGRIVNTSSNTALGIANAFDYPAVKAGLIGLSRSLALHGASLGIKVNVIMPLAATRMSAQVADPKVRKWIAETFPPRKVAPLLAWLCHESVPVSGEIFSCGGGRAARVMTTVIPGLKQDEPTPESIREQWEVVMSGGDPVVALDGSVDAQMMDDGFASIAGSSVGSERSESS